MIASLPKVTGLRCVLCGGVFAHGEVEYTCPRCGLEGILDVEYDDDLIARSFSKRTLEASRDASIWRYGALLPVPDDAPRPRLSAGWTPIVEAPALARELSVSSTPIVKTNGQRSSPRTRPT